MSYDTVTMQVLFTTHRGYFSAASFFYARIVSPAKETTWSQAQQGFSFPILILRFPMRKKLIEIWIRNFFEGFPYCFVKVGQNVGILTPFSLTSLSTKIFIFIISTHLF